MTRNVLKVNFQPDGRNVFVLSGTKAIEAAGQAGIILNTPCGGEGTCGKCRVEVVQNAPEPTAAERQHISEEDLQKGVRLACQLVIDRDVSISVPESSRFFEQMILTGGREGKYTFGPNIRKKFIRVPAPSVEDNRSGMDRFKDAVGEPCGELAVDLALARKLPAFLREQEYEATVVLDGAGIATIEAGDTSRDLWGIAFDIGTTTIVGSLLDLTTGHQAAVAARGNPQVQFGDDVVSRIRYAEEHADGLSELRGRLIACLNEIIVELTDGADIRSRAIYEVAAVGNTTMTHIFLDIDPSSIGHAPYAAVVREAVPASARELGLQTNPNARVYTLPNVAGFVGSDTVGVMLATGIVHADEVLLAVDIGTNGEVVVGNRDMLVAVSCAAGPAFEGARIRHGMRAAEGAISKVVINERIEVSAIGGGRPSGLCGSGLIDVVAELRRVGVIEETGRILQREELNGKVPSDVRDAVVEFSGQPAVVVASAQESKTNEAILLTQRDVREVQLAKAAIFAGIQVAAERLELRPEEVSRILLAGGFGNFVRRSNAKRVGLLPDVPTKRIDYVGNAAATGAKMALLSRSCREEAERISSRTEYIELASMPAFQQRYMDAMMFPVNS